MGDGRDRVSAARQRGGNRACADCEQSSPQWASVNNGVFVCLDCSGVHRKRELPRSPSSLLRAGPGLSGFVGLSDEGTEDDGKPAESLGVDTSFVRSVSMDSWSDAQMRMMELGGNEALNTFLASRNVPPTTDIWRKYHSAAAQLYRELLKCLTDGLPKPDRELSDEELGPAEPKPSTSGDQSPGAGYHDGDDTDTVGLLQASFSRLGEAASDVASSAASRASTLARAGTKEIRQNSGSITDELKQSSERLSEAGACAARRTGEAAERGWSTFRSSFTGWLKSASQSLSQLTSEPERDNDDDTRKK